MADRQVPRTVSSESGWEPYKWASRAYDSSSWWTSHLHISGLVARISILNGFEVQNRQMKIVVVFKLASNLYIVGLAWELMSLLIISELMPSHFAVAFMSLLHPTNVSFKHNWSSERACQVMFSQLGILGHKWLELYFTLKTNNRLD